MECEPSDFPERRSRCGRVKYPCWKAIPTAHSHLLTQDYVAYVTAVECCDIRKAEVPIYIAPLANLGDVLESRFVEHYCAGKINSAIYFRRLCFLRGDGSQGKASGD